MQILQDFSFKMLLKSEQLFCKYCHSANILGLNATAVTFMEMSLSRTMKMKYKNVMLKGNV